MLAERFVSRPRTGAAELAGGAAVYQPGSDRGGAALWICAGGRDCCEAGADSVAGDAAVEHADAATMAQMDPLAVGQKLLVSFVLTGRILRSEEGFDLNWQLLEVGAQSVRPGERFAWHR